MKGIEKLAIVGLMIRNLTSFLSPWDKLGLTSSFNTLRIQVYSLVTPRAKGDQIPFAVIPVRAARMNVVHLQLC